MKIIPRQFYKTHHVMCILLAIVTKVLSLDATILGKVMEVYAERKVDDFTLRLQNILENVRIRRTRSVIEKNESGTHAINNIKEFDLNSDPVSAWCSLDVEGLQYVFAGTRGGRVSLFQDSEFIELYKFPHEETIYFLLAFIYKKRIWLVGLHRNVEIHYAQIYEYISTSLILIKGQQIQLHGDSIMEITKAENDIYLLTSSVVDINSKLRLFFWTGTQFDDIISLSLRGKCQSMSMWEVQTSIFVAVSLVDKSLLEIMRFTSSNSGILTPVQILKGSFNVVKHFHVDQDQYLICAKKNEAVIYWWNGIHYLEQQIIVTTSKENIVDLSILVLPSFIVNIIIAKENNLEYFAQVNSIVFSKIVAINVADSKRIKSIIFWKERQEFYLLPVFQDYHSSFIYELEFVSREPFQSIELSNLQKCFLDIENDFQQINEDIDYIHYNISNIWIKGDSPAPPVVSINGSILSNTTVNIQELTFGENITILNFLPVQEFHTKMFEKVKRLKSDLEKAVLGSTFQEIKANIHFLDTVEVKKGKIGPLVYLNKLNEISPSKLGSVLKTNGDQVFNSVILRKGNITIVKTSFLNGQEIRDYLLLKQSHQTLKGNFSFSHLFVANVNSSVLNNLQWEDFIFSSLPQMFKDRKRFKLLSCNVISTTSLVNGINISDSSKSLIRKDSDFFASLNTSSSIVISGNLTVKYINGNNMSHLVLFSVKRNETESIYGVKEFLEPVVIKNVSLLGSVNNFNLSHILTLNMNQVIPGILHFSFIAFQNVDTNSLNNIDLSKEAVLKSSSSTVLKRVYFLNSINVSEVEMGDRATIDSLDLSDEVLCVLTKNYCTFENNFVFHNISVLKNVEIVDSTIMNILYNLQNNIWIKNKNQNISCGIFKVLAAQDIQVKTVNGVLLNDLVLANSSSCINSSKEFLNDVKGESLDVLQGKTVNNIAVNSNFLSSSIDKDAVKFTIKDILVKGNLNISSLNNIAIYDLMQVQKSQTCYGRKFFNNILVYNLTAINLPFLKFNGTNFADYKLSAVLIPHKLILNKQITHLKGQNTNIPGTLNGQDLKTIYRTAVTLNSAQNITADILFLNSLRTKAAYILSIFNLSSVLLCDSSNKNIFGKEFKGVFVAGDMKLNGKINGVYIGDLSAYMFDKKINNTVINPVIFQSSIRTTEISSQNNRTIDGISLAELINNSGSFHIESMNLSTIQVENVNISGQINHCGSFLDLFPIGLLEETELKVMRLKTFNRLEVNGNVYVNSTLNNNLPLKINQILSFLNSGHTFQGTFNFLNVSIYNLQAWNFKNGIDINFLLKDAVKNQSNEVVNGLKKIKNIYVNNTIMKNLKIQSLCGVNITLLHNKYMSKVKMQRLLLSRLPEISARDIVTKKTLNEVNLLQDLILTDTDERITFPIYINSTMTISSDIIISRNISNIDLSYLIKNRVLLSGSSNISTKLIFWEDFTALGDMKVTRFINELSLIEAVKVSERTVISGSVIFYKPLIVLSDISISGFFNNISIGVLSRNMCYASSFEYLTKLVEFSNLNISSLITDHINGISLNDLFNFIHEAEENIFTMLDTLSKKINLDNNAIHVIENASNYPLITFAYFELHQLLNDLKTLKFLPVHEAGTSGDISDLSSLQLVMWVIQNDTCRSLKSFVMDIHPNGTIKKTAVFNGRLFPFALQVLEENVKGFMLHTDRRRRCTGNTSLDFIRNVFFNGDTHSHKIVSPSNSRVVGAKLIEMAFTTYLLVAFDFNGVEEKLYLYERNSVVDNWSVQQKFHLWDVSSIDTVLVDSLEPTEIFLAVASVGIKSGIYLYIWNFKQSSFEFKIHISKPMSSAVLWVSIEQDVYLLFAKEKTSIEKKHGWVDMYTEPIEVFILDIDFDDLIVDHTINTQGVNSLGLFRLEGETYVLAVSRQLQTIYIIQNRGSNGFEVIQEINAPGVEDATIFITPNNDLLLAISSTTGHTRVLKSVARGNSHIE